MHAIDGQFGENWCESHLKDFLSAIKTFCKENHLDYNTYISNVSFSTFTAATNFIDAVKRGVENVNERKKLAEQFMQSAVRNIVIPKNRQMALDGDIEINWPLFFQLKKNPYVAPNADYKVTPDDFKWLAEQMTDVALQQIGQEKGWPGVSVANAKKWVIEKFNESVNPQGGQQYNVLFDRLSQLIRTTGIDSSILTPAALKELQELTVFCATGGRNVLNFSVDKNQLLKELDDTYNMSIDQAITNFSRSGVFQNGNSISNFLGAIQSFCNQNGLNFKQVCADVPLKLLVDQNFITQCSTEIDKINARKKEAIQGIQWIAGYVLNSTAVPVFLSTQGFSPVSDEQIISLDQRPYVFFARLCDVCSNPFGNLRGVRTDDMDDIETAAHTAIPIVASLIIDCVYAQANISPQEAGEKKTQIMQALEKFVNVNGDKLTYTNCLDQIAEVIRLAHGRLFYLPKEINTQQIQNELLNVLVPYARNGGNLQELYQMPIMQAINVLQRAGILRQGQGFPPQELQNFLTGIHTARGSNDRNFYQFINHTSISQLSTMQ